ncbi:MAG TPA: hypothetical protein VJ939_09665, partial [Bacteroidales bacterium]|nr:hypothetical protein [Bacteroidales bacterium]
LSLTVNSQTSPDYPMMNKYRQWSFVAGASLYNKGKAIQQYGNYTIETLPMMSYNAGFEYDFHPDRQWSFISGMYVALEPGYNVEYSINEEDMFPQFGAETERYHAYGITTFSFPFLVSLKKQVHKKMLANLRVGLKAMYFPPGGLYLGVSYHNEDDTDVREMFGLYADSPRNSWQGSFVVGTGMHLMEKYGLLKAQLFYVMNFQNTMKGEYLYGNLLQSGDSRGYYKLSGNYVGLLFSYSFKKRKPDYY